MTFTSLVERAGAEDGAVGGLEVLPFGLLVFVAGMLLVLNAWAVVDAKLTAEAAAREGARAFVEAPDATSAPRSAREAAEQATAGVGRDPRRLHVDLTGATFRRCGVVTVRTSYTVPALTIPFVGGFAEGITVHGRHRESLDAFRAGLGADQACG